ncbi:PLAC8 family protein [Microsporum canis CBS 113480]|uniref:PLAC8 family protein n=1 Tax=Arthroderma otae (strain ATCC MYA-4605 / CBS 113480) TaxID=554155 RepID=C5FC79_ARTOC|nr:PLAC8 family protein [Microsporum canis CBS 113480]EEQ27502.1 PLAC8 family protein [Microsporum canis CBS 113480]
MDPNTHHDTDPTMKSGFIPDPAPAGMPANKWGSPFYEFWDPIDTMLCSWFCPCFVFGRNQHRRRDPAMTDFNYFNGDRVETRKQYGIEGNEVLDFAGSCCLPCCMLIQEDKEITRRAQAAGYQRTAQMSYP